VKPVAYFA
jgi:hypothetical protein